MFHRIVLVVAVVLLVLPASAHAQLLRGRKQKDSQPTVVHLHQTTVQPVVSPIYNVEPVVSYHSPVSIYQPVVHVPTVVETPIYHQHVVRMPSVVESPVVTASAVTVEPAVVNHIPVRTPKLLPVRQVTGEVRLTNPRQTEGTLNFTLNNVSYAMQPGETRSVAIDRELVIKFDNGNQKQMAYRLSDGSYEFVVSDESGWDLVKRAGEAQVSPAKQEILAAPANAIPHRSVSTVQASSTIPTL